MTDASGRRLVHEQLHFTRTIPIEAGGERRSTVVHPRHPFREVLLSWNVDAPDDSGFTVELRVRRHDDGRWSPWLFVGEWGEVDADAPRVTEFDGGRIDVDYLVAEVELDAVQVRFLASPAGPIELHRYDLCLTRLVSEPERARPRPDPALATRLEVPARSQNAEDGELAGRICSPTSVSMVMEYRGVAEATARVAGRLYDPRHDLYGNWTRAIQGAYSFGVPGYLCRFSGLDQAEELVERGQPLVASIRAPEGTLTGAPYPSTTGHLLVILGFDERGDVIVNDPAAPSRAGVRRTYARDELERAWIDKGGVAYVFLQP